MPARKRMTGLVAPLLAAALMSVGSASAQAQKQEHTMTLRAIMSDLGTEYLRLGSREMAAGDAARQGGRVNEPEIGGRAVYSVAAQMLDLR
jgi:hypothetical protein